MKFMKCCLCGKEFRGHGNNSLPLGKNASDRCCDVCNEVYVIPARLQQMFGRKVDKQDGSKQR